SINVALVALVLLEHGHVSGGFLGALAAGGLDDLMKRGVHILGHAACVAADEGAAALLQPRVKFLRMLQHPVLYVNFLRLIARPRKVQAREQAVVLERFNLFAVEKVRRGFLIAEEEPVPALRPNGARLLKQRAERRDARPS